MESIEICIKIIGSAIIMLSGIFYGHSKGAIYQKRYVELQEWRRIFMLILAEITYGGSAMAEIIYRVKAQCSGEQWKALELLEKHMRTYRQKRFNIIWSEMLEAYRRVSMLNEQDLLALERVGQTLGSADVDKQTSMVQLYFEQVDHELELLEKVKEEKKKLFNMLGVLGSLFVIIVLI